MISKSTANIKIGLYNVENLFLLFDHPIPANYQSLSELDWQKLSTSIYDNKPLKKCIEIAKIIRDRDSDIMMLCEVGGLESLKSFNSLFLKTLRITNSFLTVHSPVDVSIASSIAVPALPRCLT